MHKKAKQIRGYNQSELIAKQISRKCNIKYLENILIKHKENQKQSELPKEERYQNVKGVYKIIRPELIEKQNILLFDDIYTTGSTIKECRKELLNAKAKKVDCLSLAKR